MMWHIVAALLPTDSKLIHRPISQLSIYATECYMGIRRLQRPSVQMLLMKMLTGRPP